MKGRRLVIVAALAVAVTAAVVMVVRPAWYLRTLYPLEYPNTIRTHAANYDLPPALIAAVIQQESGFDDHAESHAGAVGLMQLTPDTGQGIADRTGGTEWTEDDLLDPELNIRYGSWYLAHLHDTFGGDEQDPDYTVALAAYNAGQGRVSGWLAQDDDGELHPDEIPIEETREYVHNVQRLRTDYERAYPQLSREQESGAATRPG